MANKIMLILIRNIYESYTLQMLHSISETTTNSAHQWNYVVLQMSILPSNTDNMGFDLLRIISSGKRPAHIAGSIPHVSPHGEVASLLIIVQGLDDHRHNCNIVSDVLMMMP